MPPKKVVKKSATVKRKTVKTAVGRPKKTKQKPRGSSGIGKYSSKTLQEMWDKVKREGREKPTKAEKSHAFKEAWRLYKLAKK
jgi:hypothetical protein